MVTHIEELKQIFGDKLNPEGLEFDRTIEMERILREFENLRFAELWLTTLQRRSKMKDENGEKLTKEDIRYNLKEAVEKYLRIRLGDSDLDLMEDDDSPESYISDPEPIKGVIGVVFPFYHIEVGIGKDASNPKRWYANVQLILRKAGYPDANYSEHSETLCKLLYNPKSGELWEDTD